MNLFLILQMAADAMPHRIAMVSGNDRLSFADLHRLATGAAHLAGHGRKIAYLAENSAAAPVALFGAAWAGAAYVPINYRLAGETTAALLRRLGPHLLIADPRQQDDSRECIAPAAFIAACAAAAADGREPAQAEGGIAVELFTSGTTGPPKAAILRHDNLLAYILGAVEFMGAAEDEATLVTVPPYHIAGISAVLSSAYAGRRIVQLPSFTPEAWVRLAREEQVTQAFVVPTMLQRIVAFARQNGGLELPRLSAIAYGGGKMPQSVIEAAMELLPDVAFTNAYGLTETSSTIALLGPEDHRAAATATDPQVRRRIASVGRPLPGLEIEVRGQDGACVAVGEIGDLYVRGDQVSGEYHETGSLCDADGWFATRDRASCDAEGFLFLDGRADDVIVKGGENISPGEIEDVLAAHPAIAEAAAVAIPDEEWGEAIGLAVVIHDGAMAPATAELADLIRSNLRSSRVPSVIRYYPQLPYNETGKLLRREISAMLADPA
ncbi:AMP-binding protein [Croceicoccus sp. F390]|uniref:AMP-binding protein n=1 Tax=Croceicoccus esteveae TaxID=3075597 RepID=A0ABU2ZF17_9SPHN|nr:AMP-binding protein [Croceicoccus sp. F390]MDT0575197.1 AMP-binding protein [Croceicoccus sp. F390]